MLTKVSIASCGGLAMARGSGGDAAPRERERGERGEREREPATN
jgi:hypothetical protein